MCVCVCVLRNKGWGQGLEKGGREICSDREIIKIEGERERDNKHILLSSIA